MAGYDAQFYSSAAADLGRTSAAAVVEEVFGFVRPASLLDLGCGNGAWVKAFADAGVEDYRGVDGPWVDTQWLEFPSDRFESRDLASGGDWTAPSISRCRSRSLSTCPMRRRTGSSPR